MKRERVVENLNLGLRRLLEADRDVILLGDAVLGVPGVSFWAAKGLSSAFPDRVLGSPVAGSSLLGVAAGLALAGCKPIVELMRGECIGAAFDALVNFAARSVSMFGRRLDMNLLVRCPIGGGRGGAPTHGPCMQKFFLGVPDLELFELNAFVDAGGLLPRLSGAGVPCILFEDQSLYSLPMYDGGVVSGVYRYELTGGRKDVARVFVPGSERYDWLIITTGGPFGRALEAAESLLMEHEIESQILVPTQIYPLGLEALLPWIESAGRVCIVEESAGGATWGTELAGAIHRRCWGRLRAPVQLIQAKGCLMPAARHLEERLLVKADDIGRAILSEAGRA